MEYALIAVVIIVVLISSSIVLYFATSTSSTSTTSTTSTTSNGTENTEKVLNKFYTNKETFSGETDKEKEIWNEVKVLVPSGTFEMCEGPIPERYNIPSEFEKEHRKKSKAQSLFCYLAIQVKENKVDDDKWIALYMLHMLYLQDDIIAELKRKGQAISLNDIITYDANTKMITPGKMFMQGDNTFTAGTPVSLNVFMEKLKKKLIKDMTPEVKVNPDGSRETSGLLECDLCYKNTRFFEDIEGDKIAKENAIAKEKALGNFTNGNIIQMDMRNNMSTEMEMKNNINTEMQMKNIIDTEMEMKKKQENFTMYF